MNVVTYRHNRLKPSRWGPFYTSIGNTDSQLPTILALNTTHVKPYTVSPAVFIDYVLIFIYHTIIKFHDYIIDAINNLGAVVLFRTLFQT